METLVLSSNEVRLMLMVEKAGYNFYPLVSNFLKEQKDAPEEEVLPELVLKKYEFRDIPAMVKEYLSDDFTMSAHCPSEKEEFDLRIFLERFT